MPLAIFDLDHTLLQGDSDYAWGQFLIAHGAVEAEVYESANQRYYEQYKAGTLDIHEFLGFALAPLAHYPRAQLDAWHRQFMREAIRPMITPAARALVARHRAAGDTLLIITATNSFVTRPIAAEFGIPHLLATEPEEVDGEFTGRAHGVPCFREGKVTRLAQWLRDNDCSLEGSWFYSDSHNDLPLLQRVTHPVAVHPDPVLEAQARERGWPIVDLK